MTLDTAPLLRGFVAELVAAGVGDVVVCPGSRSTPLALALRAHPALRVRVLLDERSAGFFALGMAKASGRPVAVLVTSGTAVANLMPAVVEANLARVPLLLLTADRPAELRDVGAAQTVDQVRIFGEHARWFAELPLADGAPETQAQWRTVAGRAVALATGSPAGPVHLNVPFREPLIPAGPLAPERPAHATEGPRWDRRLGRRTLAPAELDALAARLRAAGRGLIVAGPADRHDPELPAALARLARVTGWPIVADPLSGLRAGPHDRSAVIAHADLLLRPGRWRDAHRPELVLRVGAIPTSKPLNTWLAEVGPELLVVDGDGGWREPTLARAIFLHADPAATADALAVALADRPPPIPDWLTAWRTADATAVRAMADWLGRRTTAGEPFEGAPVPALADLLPDGAILWVSSSMPVRDLDAWLPSTARAIRPLANRGANGIDGVVSSALGAAAALADAAAADASPPVALLIGDLAFLHDANALVTAHRFGLSLTIVLVENDGGGIFSFLPQASAQAPEVGLPDRYEELFGTPHGLELGAIARAFGARHRLVGPGDLREALAVALPAPGVDVLELRTERGRNRELHAEVAAAVGAELGGGG